MVERLWRDLSDDLRRFIARRVPDSATAADILQDTFLKIHEHLSELRDEQLLAPWVYRIARNVIIEC